MQAALWVVACACWFAFALAPVDAAGVCSANFTAADSTASPCDWTSGSCWTPALVPLSFDGAQIGGAGAGAAAGVIVRVTQNATVSARTLSVMAGATLELRNGTLNLYPAGACRPDGVTLAPTLTVSGVLNVGAGQPQIMPRRINATVWLPEAPLPDSVLLIITPISAADGGPSADTAGARTLTLRCTTAGNYSATTLPLDRLSVSAALPSLVASVAPAVDLVNGTLYSMTLQYRDALANPITSAPAVTNLLFVNLVPSVVISAPAPNAVAANPFVLDVSVPAAGAARSGSASLTFSRTSGAADASSPHAALLGSAMLAGVGRYAFGVPFGVAPTAAVTSISPAGANLTHDAVYDVTLSYTDALLGDAHQITVSGVTIDLVPPAVTSTTPAAGATGTAINADRLSFTFGESGVTSVVDASVQLWRAGTTAVRRFALPSAAVLEINSAVAGATTFSVSLPRGTINQPEATYYVLIATGAFVDRATNRFGGFRSPTAWSFQSAPLQAEQTVAPDVPVTIAIRFAVAFAAVPSPSDPQYTAVTTQLVEAVAFALDVDTDRVHFLTLEAGDSDGVTVATIQLLPAAEADQQIALSPSELSLQIRALISTNGSAWYQTATPWPVIPSGTTALLSPVDPFPTALVAGLAVGGFLTVVLMAAGRLKGNDQTDVIPVAVLFLTLVDAVADVAFINEMRNDRRFGAQFTASVVFTAANYVLNFGFTNVQLYRETKANGKMQQWMNNNSHKSLMAMLIVIGVSLNLDLVLLTKSLLFASAAFAAPWSTARVDTFDVFGLVSIVCKDVPRFAIKLSVFFARDVFTNTTLLSFVTTIISIAYGLLNKSWTYIRRRTEQQHANNNNNPVAPNAGALNAVVRNGALHDVQMTDSGAAKPAHPMGQSSF